MDKVSIQRAEVEHVYQMLDIGLRASDVQEVYQFDARSPFSALMGSFKTTPNVYIAVVDGSPAAMFGVRPLGVMTREGVPWLLATDIADNNRLSFGRVSRMVFDCMTRDYDYLQNYADSENKRGLVWLKWLGFALDPNPVHIGPFRHPFRRFYWRR